MKPMNRARHLGITAVARDYRRHRRNDRGLHRQFFRHSLHASHAPEFNDHNRLILHSWGSIFPDHEKMRSSTWHDIAAELLGRVHFVATAFPQPAEMMRSRFISGAIALTIIVYVSSQWDKFN